MMVRMTDEALRLWSLPPLVSSGRNKIYLGRWWRLVLLFSVQFHCGLRHSVERLCESSEILTVCIPLQEQLQSLVLVLNALSLQGSTAAIWKPFI